MPKLTKKLVEKAGIRDKDYVIFDSTLPGFGVRILPSGRRSYLVQYRRGRRYRRMAIGYHGVLTTEKARAEAIRILGEVVSGKDPAAERSEARHAPTIADLCQRTIQEYSVHHCKPSTVVGYRALVKSYINPRIGRISVAEITRTDIARFHHEVRYAPYQANRCLQFMSKMFNLAEIWGLRPDGSNPCRHVKKYPEKKRERFLSPEELKRLGDTLRECEDYHLETPSAIAALRLLILTGCRLGEIMTLKWEYVDFEKGALHLPDSKTGAKTVHIGRAAVEALGRIKRLPGNPWVIYGKLPGARLTDLQHPWRRIRKRAKLDDVRIHDLRHSFASSAVNTRYSLPMIGKLLDHSQVQTTARYAHLAADPVREAADRVSRGIADVMDG